MKIQYCSDLHLEFAQNEKFLADNPIQAVGDILVLAGDIIYWEPENFKHRFFDYVSDHFKAVYYIPGNHEFYSGKEVQILDRPVFEPLRENVFLVNNKQKQWAFRQRQPKATLPTLWNHGFSSEDSTRPLKSNTFGQTKDK